MVLQQVDFHMVAFYVVPKGLISLPLQSFGMDVLVQSQNLRHVEIRRLVLIMGTVVAAVVVLQCSVLANWKSIFVSSPDKGSIAFVISNETILDDSRFTLVNTSDSYEEGEYEKEYDGEKEDYDLTLDFNKHLGDSFKSKDQNSRKESILGKSISNGKSLLIGNVARMKNSSSQTRTIEMGHNLLEPGEKKVKSYTINDEAKASNFSGTARVASSQDPVQEIEDLNTNSGSSDVVTAMSLTGNVKQTMETQQESNELLQTLSVILTNNSLKARISLLKRRKKQSISINQMDTIFARGLISSHSVRPRWSSPRDRELLSAKREIENAPTLRDIPGLYTSVFRNISRFRRSYDLMERVLKVYVYKEGQKPIFHQPKMRGIYASEGWFMKLIEGNKNFIVRDPRKAHLFYLPVSIKNLRSALGQDFQSPNDLKGSLRKYAELIAGKHKFWNRTGGADHFLAACHDWAPKLTKPHMKNCIRALCNANAAEGFNIGKDTTLPVTYIRSAEAPLEHLGGKPSSERHILAFFAGSMHGYLRPILLEYWEKKEADMKIFGPLPRDNEGRRSYREHMKSSKYCICARGYEVHTPRVVEAIFYECVPVIISDNYVPPFFEVLNWEAFAVFVQEKDIPNLRNILLSISEEKYIAMQSRVKMVQQHFLWHKKPVKYDLFHMTLHSIWYNRVFQMKIR